MNSFGFWTVIELVFVRYDVSTDVINEYLACIWESKLENIDNLAEANLLHCSSNGRMEKPLQEVVCNRRDDLEGRSVGIDTIQ